MALKITVPALGDQAITATVTWLRSDGEYVWKDERLAALATKQFDFEMNAEEAGVLQIVHQMGAVVRPGDTLGTIEVCLPPARLRLGPIQARLVKARPLRRVIRLSGAVEATVEYDGWGLGYETVTVNGELAVRVRSSEQFAHRLEFDLAAPQIARAWLDVSTAMLKMSVRLTVAGRVVWSEGAYGLVGGQSSRAELPIPTFPANESVANLPGVSKEPSERNDGAG